MSKQERFYTINKLKKYNNQLAKANKNSKINLSFTIGCSALALASYSSDELIPVISELLTNEQLLLNLEDTIILKSLGVAWTICSIIAGAATVQDLSRKAYLETAISNLEDDLEVERASLTSAKKLVYKQEQ